MPAKKKLIYEAVGLLDDDIISRFHVVIGIQPLEPLHLLFISESLISGLTQSHDNLRLENGLLETLREDAGERLQHGWNARQIQNGASHYSYMMSLC